MHFRWQKTTNLLGLMFLFGFLGLLLGCVGNKLSESATAVPSQSSPSLIVFYTDN